MSTNIKCFAGFLLFISFHLSFAQGASNPYEVMVLMGKAGKVFEFQASYLAPVNTCQAYAFLTDYEGAKKIPGIIESNILNQSGNRVFVERVAVESILFFPIKLRSVIEFIELSDKEIKFNQIEGDAKEYKGSWVIAGEKKGTRLTYHAIFELDTAIPFFIIKHFLENSAKKRFEIIAQYLHKKNNISTLVC